MWNTTENHNRFSSDTFVSMIKPHQDWYAVFHYCCDCIAASVDCGCGQLLCDRITIADYHIFSAVCPVVRCPAAISYSDAHTLHRLLFEVRRTFSMTYNFYSQLFCRPTPNSHNDICDSLCAYHRQRVTAHTLWKGNAIKATSQNCNSSWTEPSRCPNAKFYRMLLVFILLYLIRMGANCCRIRQYT